MPRPRRSLAGLPPVTLAPAPAVDVTASGALSLRGAARFLGGVSVKVVRDLIRARLVRAVVIGRRVTVPRDELRRFLRQLLEEQSPKGAA